VIVGEEIMTTHGEIIAYFLTQEVPRGLSPQETVKRLRDQGAVISVPHPLDSVRGSAMGMANVLTILEAVDALEVLNARCVFGRDNAAALQLAQKHNKLLTAGSDAHIPFEVGRAYLEMPPFADDPVSFLAALKQAKVCGGVSPFWPHFASSYAKWRKRLRPVTLPVVG
jgi:predicted metal-dependent phosphoesterase TrpH